MYITDATVAHNRAEQWRPGSVYVEPVVVVVKEPVVVVLLVEPVVRRPG